jgi:hypothetical protein
MRGEAVRVRFLFAILILVCAAEGGGATLSINENRPIFVDAIPFTISGTASPNAEVAITIDRSTTSTPSTPSGTWSLTWTTPLKTGTYDLTATSDGATVTQILRVQLPGRLQRESGIEPAPPRYGAIALPNPDAAQVMTDRWRIVPPPYELDEHARHPHLDPYNQNRLKGDRPISHRCHPERTERVEGSAPPCDDTFFVFTGVSDTLSESRTLPTPSGVSTERPGSIHFFGRDNQNFFNQNFDLSFDVFQGDTAFKPVSQRVKLTIVANLNALRVREDAIVKPDVRRGTKRRTSYVALQEFFYERTLRDLSPNYDFVSIRAGSQPFSSDFRGFIFSDTNLGVRLFGSYASNRYQYNLAVFDRLEKDTNSGLNIFHERRDQQVGVANFYMQDFLRKGYTQEFSLHVMHDGGGFKYDRNGILVRPAPVGDFKQHEINAVYIGEAGLGHIGRFNVDQALYFVFGRDSLNPIAGTDPKLRDRNSVHIGAGMAAAEVSYDHDWLRPRVAIFYASGDRNPRDRNARGFDSIFDSPNFAGGGFSFFNRLGIGLAGTGVSLVDRGSLLPSLRSSKDEGQPNYVNPGVIIGTIGLDIDVTPRLKALLNANTITLDTTKPLEEVLFQGDIHRHLGEDVSLGLRYRPFLSNNIVIAGGVAGFHPGQGFADIYESKRTLYHVFTNVILTF